MQAGRALSCSFDCRNCCKISISLKMRCAGSEAYNPPVCRKSQGENMKIKTAVAFLVLFCSLALSINVQCKNKNIAEKIKQLQQDQINAQMKNDVAWAQEHLADGFVAGHSWGKWETKADFIKNWQSKANKWTS